MEGGRAGGWDAVVLDRLASRDQRRILHSKLIRDLS